MTNFKDKLQNLLSESQESANQRVADYLAAHYSENRPTVLFGAGNVGSEVAQRLTALGHKPACFMDDTPSKKGTTIAGVPVLSREEALAKYGADCNLVVTILNPKHNFAETHKFFTEKGIKAMTFMGLSWAYPEAFYGMHGITHPAKLLDMKHDVLEFFDLLADEKSKAEFYGQLAFRMTLDFTTLTPKEEGVYFPSDIPLSFEPRTTFLDAGAFDGDSVENAAQNMGQNLGRVIAFEPDPRNFKALESRVTRLKLAEQSSLHQAAVGAKEETLYFNATGDMSASLSSAGGLEVKVEPLAKYVSEENMYLKFDIEGHEETAITAALENIKAFKPQMAISVYHKPTDLWQIPLMLHKAVPEYKFYLRNHGIDATDFICYALHA